jgi:hypothetical protein
MAALVPRSEQPTRKMRKGLGTTVHFITLDFEGTESEREIRIALESVDGVARCDFREDGRVEVLASGDLPREALVDALAAAGYFTF